MNNIIITIIICISVIVIISIFCYTNYKMDENSKNNRFYSQVKDTNDKYTEIINKLIKINNNIISIRNK